MQVSPTPLVTDVYASELPSAISAIDRVVRAGYTYVALDTEFPGMLHRTRFEDRSTSAIYAIMKRNVDALKPIQFGLSFTDAKGNRPFGTCTWQFNMRFDANSDVYDPKGMEMLKDAKLPLERFASEGIEIADLRSAVLGSELFGNSGLTWLSFHGAYDFGYWLKVITGAPLPESLLRFNEARKAICPIIYDAKMLIQSNESIANYSLGKLARVFCIPQHGTLHQAGTDALVTAELYFKVKKHLLGDKAKKFENKLYGLSKVFSLGSAEYETKSNRKSLLDTLKGTKTSSSGQKISAELPYGVVLLPAYDDYSGYSGFGVSRGKGGRFSGTGSFKQTN